MPDHARAEGFVDDSFVAIARFDWVVPLSGRRRGRLHALGSLDDPAKTEFDWGGPGTTACGIHDDWLEIPGLFSRMGVERCEACCAATGLPEGVGSPKNDPELRRLVGLDV